MNRPLATAGWAFATLAITFVAAYLLHPAVIIGTMIGVAMTTAKNLHLGE